ncbi:hypothetical protein AB0C38_37575 [Amycolatopsis sp. NPDC048633]|uniref:hypothetical protein n=1 Tax=Amycolatopsis sp. NPDC048633 TaxID=3157095 RepID=UPI0033EB8DC0
MSTDAVTVLEGMYAAETEYLTTGDFAPLAPFFAPDVVVAEGRITEVRPFYWDTAAIAAACST